MDRSGIILRMANCICRVISKHTYKSQSNHSQTMVLNIKTLFVMVDHLTVSIRVDQLVSLGDLIKQQVPHAVAPGM